MRFHSASIASVASGTMSRMTCGRNTAQIGWYLIFAAMLGIFANGKSAIAEVTPEDLINKSVTPEVGPHYKDLEEAIAAFKRGDLKATRDRLASAVKQSPKLGPQEVLLAVLLLDANQPGPARNELE